MQICKNSEIVLPQSFPIYTTIKLRTYVLMHICKFTINLAPNEAPRNFRNISGTSTTITFQWDRLFLLSQRNRIITQYVITCSSLDRESIFTVSNYVMHVHMYIDKILCISKIPHTSVFEV